MDALSNPEWHLAVATWLLALVTVVAACFGVPAGIAAANTFRLESEPVLLIRQLWMEEQPPIDESRLMDVFAVDATPVLARGIELRPWQPNDKGHPNKAVMSTTILELHNAGRSPALAVRIPFEVTIPMLSKIDIDTESGGADVDLQEGTGEIVVVGIAANGSVYVEVDNYLGNQVTLRAAEFGSSVRIGKRDRRAHPLPIVTLGPILIPKLY